MDVTQPAIKEPAAGATVGAPTTALPFGQLLNLSVYWAGLNAVWAGLGFVVYPARFSEMFGAAWAPTLQTLFETFPVLLAIVVQPTVATISDYTISRWGRRKPYIFIGALLDVLFLYGFASSNVIVVMFAFIMLLQFSSNFAQGPFQGYVPDLVPKQQVGLASGFMGVMIVVGQGIGVGIAALGLIQLNGSPYVAGTPEAGAYAQQVFMLPTVGLALVEVVTMVPLVLFVREGRSAPSRGGRSWFQIGLSAWGTDILREHSYVWMLVSRLFFLMAPTLPLSIGLYFLRQSLGSSDDEAAKQLFGVVAAVGVTTGLSTLPAAKLSDRFGRKNMIYFGIAVGLVGIGVLALAPSFEIALAALILIGVSSGSFLAVDWALMTDIIPKATTGRYMGISAVATGLSGPLARLLSLPLLSILVVVGLPAGLDPATQSDQSSFYASGPRIVILIGIAFYLISAWALHHVDPTRREV